MLWTVFFFFLMTRRPPRSTLFPTRRSSDLAVVALAAFRLWTAYGVAVIGWRGLSVVNVPRSEEHTSELQSLRHLVCRLLLEKKKKFAKLGIQLESFYSKRIKPTENIQQALD